MGLNRHGVDLERERVEPELLMGSILSRLPLHQYHFQVHEERNRTMSRCPYQEAVHHI